LPKEGTHQATPEGIAFFEKNIRPVLVDRCYKCHSEKADKVKGGLTLDTREGMVRGGDNGPSVVPGKLDESLLIEAIRYKNKDFAMPPDKSGGKLPDSVIADFEKWVTMGAPDPRGGPAKAVARKQEEWEKARNWWAWQLPKESAVPTVKDAAWPLTDADRFILAALEAKGLRPVADADKLTWIRRVTFDLVGLPPSPVEVDAFLKDTTPQAFEKVVDRLLASPAYGERWGRHWLDVTRYAESSGKDVNVSFPHAWRYRDYVIQSFNKNKPFDQFLKEQLAGDLMSAKDDGERAERKVATGFLAIGAKSLNEQNPRQFFLDMADEQVDTVSQAFLATTVSCARCHDHKFDPITQREYYALAGIFTSTETLYGTAAGILNRHSSELIELPAGVGITTSGKTLSASERKQKEARLEELRKEQRELFADLMAQRRSNGGTAPNPGLRPLVVRTEIGRLELELKSYDETSGAAKALAMGARDLPAYGTGGAFGRAFRQLGEGRLSGIRPPDFSTVRDLAFYARGDVDKPGEKVPRGFPAVMAQGNTPEVPDNRSGRLEMAEWMVSDGNPLTARVFVNRVWNWMFGEGIVASPDNFGTTGRLPSNQALLDTLAVRFVRDGWNVKNLVRTVALSRAYRLASTYDERNFAADPENHLVWRMSQRRLDAECIRDAMLAISGGLDMKPPLGSEISKAGDGVMAQGFRGINESVVQRNIPNRSVYLPIGRDLLPEVLELFDFAETSLVTGARDQTNVPSQALWLLNSEFSQAQAKAFATRIVAQYPAGKNAGVSANMDQRVIYAYWLALGRPPTAGERQAAFNFFTRFPGNWKPGSSSAPALRDADGVEAAWTSFCRALFASSEFRYLR
jgi:hypothetical protein